MVYLPSIFCYFFLVNVGQHNIHWYYGNWIFSEYLHVYLQVLAPKLAPLLQKQQKPSKMVEKSIFKKKYKYIQYIEYTHFIVLKTLLNDWIIYKCSLSEKFAKVWKAEMVCRCAACRNGSKLILLGFQIVKLCIFSGKPMDSVASLCWDTSFLLFPVSHYCSFFIKISWQPHGHPQHISEQSSLPAKSGEANENARVPSISPVPWHFFHQWKNTNGLAEHLYRTLWIERPNYMTSLHTSLNKNFNKKVPVN